MVLDKKDKEDSRNLQAVGEMAHPSRLIEYANYLEIFSQHAAHDLRLIAVQIGKDIVSQMRKINPPIIFYEGINTLINEDLHKKQWVEGDDADRGALFVVWPWFIYKTFYNPSCEIVFLDKGFAPFEKHEISLFELAGNSPRFEEIQNGREEHWTGRIDKYLTTQGLIVVGAGHLYPSKKYPNVSKFGSLLKERGISLQIIHETTTVDEIQKLIEQKHNIQMP